MSDNIETEKLQEALKSFVDALHGGTEQLTDEQKYAKKLADSKRKMDDEFKQAMNNQYNAVSKFTGNISSLTKQATTNAGSFAILNSVVDITAKALGSLVEKIPFAGGAMKAFGDAAGDVTKLMIDQYQQSWNAYKDLAQVGLVSNFTDLKSAVGDTNLSFTELSKVLTPHAKTFANFGGSVGRGTAEFRRMSSDLEPVRKQFAYLGVSAEEFGDMQAGFMSQELRFSKKREGDMTTSAKDYIEQLTTLSRLTGMRAKDIQAEREAALSETRFAAVLDDLSDDTRNAFLNLNTIIGQKAGPDVAQGFRDMMAGIPDTEAAKSLYMKTNGEALNLVMDLQKKVKPTTEDVIKVFNGIQAAVKPNLPMMKELGKFAQNSSVVTKDLAQYLKLARAQLSPEAYKELVKSIDNTKAGNDKATTSLATTEQTLRDMTINLQLFATSSDAVTIAMDGMAQGLDYMTETLFAFAKKQLPEDVKARLDERKAIVQAAKARIELNEAEEAGQKLQDQYDEKLKKNDGKQGPGAALLTNLETQIAVQQRKIAELQAKAMESDNASSKATAKRKAISPTSSNQVAAQNTALDDMAKAKIKEEAEKKATAKPTDAKPADDKKAAPAPATEKPKDDKKAAPAPATAPATEKPKDDKKAAPAPATAPATEKPKDDSNDRAALDLSKLFEFNPKTGTRANFDGMSQDMKDRLISAAIEYNRATDGKGKISISSASRSKQEQENLKKESPSLAAEPGKSKHETGEAIDLNVRNAPNILFEALAKQGLRNNAVSNEPWHFEKMAKYANGGIADKASIFGEAGPEAAVPLPDGRHIPVKLDDGGLVKMLAEKLDTLVNRQDRLAEQLEEMNEHMEKSAGNSEKLVRAAS